MGKFATETGEYTDIGDHHGRRWRASAFVFFFGRGRVGEECFFGEILLMEEILHHLGCIKPCK